MSEIEYRPEEIRLLLLKKLHEKDWLEAGRLLHFIKEKKLYLQGFDYSFKNFLDKLPIIRPRIAHKLIEFYKRYKDKKIPKDLTVNEIIALLKISPKQSLKIINSDDIIEQVLNITKNKKYPISFEFSEDEIGIITEAVDYGKDIYNSWSKEDIIVLACLEFLANVTENKAELFFAMIQALERLFNVRITVEKKIYASER